MPKEVYFIPASGEEHHKLLSQKTEKIYQALDLDEKIERDAFVALKIHFGEKGNKGYIKPSWLQLLVKNLKQKTSRVFLTDTNTLYVGHRSNTVDHLQLAWGHGFSLGTLGVPVIIADGLIGRDDEEIEVNLPRIKSVRIAGAFLNSDALLCLSHFTGHMLTGFGAAIKNLGMGCASRAGKLVQHADVHPQVNPNKCKYCRVCFDYCPVDAIIEQDEKAHIIEDKCIGCGECLVVCTVGAVTIPWDSDNTRVQEKMAEYAWSIQDLFKDKIGHINFLIKMTKDCDCMCTHARSMVADIGILASRDPVAVDTASVDLINEKAGKDVLREHHNFDWSIQLRHGEKIGLGSTDYQLIQLP